MAKVEITNGDGKQAHVTNDQALLVTQTGIPPVGLAFSVLPFVAPFTDDGTTAGSPDLNVNGAGTPVEFWVPADPESDIYITGLSFAIGYGTSAQPYQFADGAALTNGLRLFYDSLYGDSDIFAAIKDNLGALTPGISISGFVPGDWEIRGVGALNDYGYVVGFEMAKLVPGGIKLAAGTNQRLVFAVQDNISAAVDNLTVTAFGYKRLPTG